MLTKLISHEWKDTFKVPALLLTITVLLSAASLVYFSVADQAAADIDLNVRNFVLYIAYILILSGLSMILTIYFAIRFYKNLYTDEGYLMHTLPVKPWMLIVSKLTIGTIWFYLIDLLLVGAITLITCPQWHIFLRKICWSFGRCSSRTTRFSPFPPYSFWQFP